MSPLCTSDWVQVTVPGKGKASTISYAPMFAGPHFLKEASSMHYLVQPDLLLTSVNYMDWHALVGSRPLMGSGLSVLDLTLKSYTL